MVDLQAQAFHTDTQIISIAPGQLRPHMAITYIYNLDHLNLRVVTTGSKYLMGAQHTVQELKGKAAISHLGECVAVEGFFLWSSRQTGVLRNQAFQLLTGLYHVVKKHLSAYPLIFDKTYFSSERNVYPIDLFWSMRKFIRRQKISGVPKRCTCVTIFPTLIA